MTQLQQCMFVPKAKVDEALAKGPKQGKHLLPPLDWKDGFPVGILEDSEVSNEAEVHRHEADLWICLGGEVEFIVGGGEMVDPWAKELPGGGTDDREIKAKEIKGGTSYNMKEGDMLHIPAGQPHLHKTEGTARLYIVKIPALEEVPLGDVHGWNE